VKLPLWKERPRIAIAAQIVAEAAVALAAELALAALLVEAHELVLVVQQENSPPDVLSPAQLKCVTKRYSHDDF